MEPKFLIMYQGFTATLTISGAKLKALIMKEERNIHSKRWNFEEAFEVVKELEFAVWRKKVFVDVSIVYFCQSKCEY